MNSCWGDLFQHELFNCPTLGPAPLDGRGLLAELSLRVTVVLTTLTRNHDKLPRLPVSARRRQAFSILTRIESSATVSWRTGSGASGRAFSILTRIESSATGNAGRACTGCRSFQYPHSDGSLFQTRSRHFFKHVSTFSQNTVLLIKVAHMTRT